MNDLISREKLIDYLYENNVRADISIEDLADEIFAEPKVGRWIAVDSDDMIYDHYKCSNCWCEISVDSKRICDIGFTIEDFNYCPNCGAKMEGE